MTADERARAVRRDDLEGAVFPRPDVEALFDGLALVRVTRLSRFWTDAGTDRPALLQQAVVDWLAGLHGLQTAWVAMLRSSGARVECWFGAGLTRAALRHSLVGAFADLRFGADPFEPHAATAGLPHALRVTGAPAVKADSPQVEKVCRALSAAGRAWCLVTRADPLAEPAIRALAQETADALFETRLSLGKGEPVRRPQIERCAELLDARAARFDAARMTGLWRCQTWLLAEDEPTLRLAGGVLRSALAGESAGPEPLRVHACSGGAPPPDAPEPLSSAEAAVLARPPAESYAGYTIVDHARFGLDAPASARGSAVSLGVVIDRGRRTRTRFRVPLVDLTKHALIAGVTGSGKTNTCFRLLTQLWHVHRVPFLVIEPAKSEYRRLLANRRWRNDLLVFTAAQETLSPLHLNPFDVPDGVLVQSHIDYLKALFQAAFVLYPPTPQVLEAALHDVYRQCGWNLATNENPRGASHPRSVPTLEDLIESVRRLVPDLGYSEQLALDIEASLITRLESLRAGGGKGPLLGGRTSASARLLFERPVILELKQIVNEDEKAFVMGLLLIRLYEHHEAWARQGIGAPRLRHVTLFEEAHRLLRDVSTEASADMANPRGQALEVFTNMLAEIRAYGEGVLIAEQIPSKLTRDVIKNTNLKVAHRLTSKDDRELLGASMNMSDAARGALTSLERGTAAIFAEGLEVPALVRVPKSAVKDVALDEARVAQAMQAVTAAGGANDHATAGREAAGRAAEDRAADDRAALDGRAADPRTQRAFARALHACVRAEPDLGVVLTTLAEFRQSAGRLAPAASSTASVRDLWRRLADREIVRRAAFWGWPHETVDRCVEQCAAIGDLEAERYAVALAIAQEETPPRALRAAHTAARARMAKAIAAFAAQWDALHDSGAEPPFAGCVHCDRPCLYRPIARVETGRVAEWFDPDVEEILDDVAETAVGWTTDQFHREDRSSIAEAALCFAVQQIDREAFSARVQSVVTERIKARIHALVLGA